ncbi:MAG: GGDEF domain-containing protein [Actinobacteria bacterium]|nr:GGDEF domain-containing protein [Actinomycetota bacterium]
MGANRSGGTSGGAMTRVAGVRLVGAGLGLLALALMVVLTVDSPAWVAVSVGTQLAAVVVFLVVALRMPRRARSVWWTLWVYVALTVSANVVYDVYQYHLGMDPFPSWADLLYVAAYVPQIVALIVLMRQRQRVWDRQAWIDSAVITVAAVSVATTFVLVPMLNQPAPADASTILALAYPVLDLVVLAILIRLTVGGGRPMAALVLLTASVAVTLTADLVYNGLAATGSADQAPGWLEALYLGGVLLMAGAATDPQAATIGQPSPQGTSMMSPPRTLALGIGALTAPILLAVGTRDDGTPQVFVLALASIVVNVLVIWRILLLLSTVQRQSDRLAALSRTDALTSLPNRRSWDFELIRAVAAANAAGMPLTVAMADIDHFKDYNDAHGHLAGDALLETCARQWRAELDPSIFLARYGGEEFALILSGSCSFGAPQYLEGMRRTTPPPVTVSIGYADHDAPRPIVATVEEADRALYAAKAAGRDRVLGSPTRPTDRTAQLG